MHWQAQRRQSLSWQSICTLYFHKTSHEFGEAFLKHYLVSEIYATVFKLLIIFYKI